MSQPTPNLTRVASRPWRAVSPARSRCTPSAPRNAELWDVEGRRYIDFASGISVLNTGHLHPQVRRRSRRSCEASRTPVFRSRRTRATSRSPKQLNALAPGAAPKKTIFLTTGAEAVENAIKIARFPPRRSAVIAFSGGFHGRTLACISLTGKVQPYKAGFGPMLPEIYHLPFPMPYHGITVEHSLACARAAVQGGRRPGARRRDHHRAGARRRRLLCGAGGAAAAAAQRVRRARHRAHRRRDPVGLRTHRPHVRDRALAASSLI